VVATVDAHARDQLLEQCPAGRVLPVREGVGDMGADLVEVSLRRRRDVGVVKEGFEFGAALS
jgi:hypothetical protein